MFSNIFDIEILNDFSMLLGAILAPIFRPFGHQIQHLFGIDFCMFFICVFLDFGRKWAPNLWAGASIFRHFFPYFSDLGFGLDFVSFWADFGCILEPCLSYVWSNFNPFSILVLT